MLWAQFVGACFVIIIAGRKLVSYASSLAEEKGWGNVWVGFTLLAVATSLPEIFTSAGSVIFIKAPDLALGNILGSILFNIVIIAILDFMNGTDLFMGKTNMRLILCGSLSIILSTLIIAGISTSASFTIARLGPFSIIILFTYLLGARLISRFEKDSPGIYRGNSIINPLLKYLICASFILGASIWLVHTAEEIAFLTGWGETFTGVLFLGIATSMPEATTSISAMRRGAFDMAIGNILGSNMLNVMIVSISDVFMPGAGILSMVSVNHIFTAVLGILMTATVIVGIIYKSKTSFLRLGFDAIAIIIMYVAGSYLLFCMR